MDIQKEHKINADLFKEKIDVNLLNGSIEIALLNRLFKNKLNLEKNLKFSTMDSVFNIQITFS
jgi:hypothetical protein